MERLKETLIVDASVIAKWFVTEEHTSEALTLRDAYLSGEIDLWSTELMPYEVLNALRHKPEIDARELRTAAKALAGYRIALHPLLGELGELSVENALRYGLTIYDSSYVSQSLFFDKPLYTADEKLLAKTRALTAIHHISEYPG